MFTRPIEVCCFSAHEDKRFLKKLEAHLSALQCDGIISVWHDGYLTPGEDLAQAIDSHLDNAQVILLLISSHALAYNYSSRVDVERVLQRHWAHETRLIPVLLRPVDWQCASLTTIQALPTNAKPITTWRNQDEAFANVTTDIRRVVEDLSTIRSERDRARLSSVFMPSALDLDNQSSQLPLPSPCRSA
jgi:hypothetical protein